MLPFLTRYINNLVIKGCTSVLMVRLIVLAKDLLRLSLIVNLTEHHAFSTEGKTLITLIIRTL